MNNLTKQINELLLNDDIIKEYLSLKKEIEEDSKLVEMYNKLDKMRKVICKNKDIDSSDYYSLLEIYNNDKRIKRFNWLKKQVYDVLADISDILSLK